MVVYIDLAKSDVIASGLIYLVRSLEFHLLMDVEATILRVLIVRTRMSL